jgi:hypothetical protein
MFAAFTQANNASCVAVASCGYLPFAVDGSRGYADLDGNSNSACQSCPLGTFASTDELQQCADFDECTSRCAGPVIRARCA